MGGGVGSDGYLRLRSPGIVPSPSVHGGLEFENLEQTHGMGLRNASRVCLCSEIQSRYNGSDAHRKVRTHPILPIKLWHCRKCKKTRAGTFRVRCYVFPPSPRCLSP